MPNAVQSTHRMLGLSSAGLLAASEERVHVAIEELQDLKGVWAELAKIWEQLEQLKEQSWLSIQPRKVRNTSSQDSLLLGRCPLCWCTSIVSPSLSFLPPFFHIALVLMFIFFFCHKIGH